MLLTPYQQDWLNDLSRFKLALKSRRIGFTFAGALDVALSAIAGEPEIVFSASQLQSSIFVRECAAHIRTMSELAGVSLFERDPAVTAIRTFSGGSVLAMSARPESARGLTGNVTLDEFAWCPNSRKLWTAVKAITDPTLGNPRGYKLRAMSSPAGDDPDNVFYQLWTTDAGAEFSKHKITIFDAVAQGFPADPERLRAEAIDDEDFEQEYNCQFASASSRYISAELYDRAVYLPEALPKVDHPLLYGGMDVARKRDRSAIELGMLVGDTLWNHEGEDRHKVPWDEQERWAAELLERPGFRRFCVDETGVGSMFAERLKLAYPSIVEPVTFGLKVNEALATGLKLAYERGKLRVRDDLDLRRDVLKLRKLTTAAGNVRYEAPREKGRHADKAWAQALMVHALGGFARSHGKREIHTGKPALREIGW